VGWPGGGRAQLRREAAVTVELLEARLQEIVTERWQSTVTVARLPITIACRRLIADVPARLPIASLRDGEPVWPTPTILVRPDPDTAMSRRRWVHRAAMSLSGAGNLYALVTRMGANEWPLAAEVVPPDLVAPRPDPIRPWRVEGWSVSGQEYAAADVIHVPLLELDLSSPVARSPLADCQDAFDDLAVMWAFATQYWQEGGKPPYALRYEGRMDGGKAAAALEQWIAARRAHRPGLLTGGWDIKDLMQPTAQDALLLDGLAYIEQSIAKVYGVPPTLVNVRAETGSLTYTNAREELARWLTIDLGATYLARIEDAFTAMLPRGQQARFDPSGFITLGLATPGLDEGRNAGAPAPAPTPDAPALPAAPPALEEAHA
jgi:HK97 family phage portal protein